MPHTNSTPTLLWDVFCEVIDNWGDAGVCWRLASQLAAQGQQVRLWMDQPELLDWMAPGARQGQWPGIECRVWTPRHPSPPPALPPGDVLIEAFGCTLPDAWVMALAPLRVAPGPQPVWINLEYLSAEPYVERCHRLPSPVLHGPLSGRQKWFFYPGFTSGTGGLLREPGLLDAQARFDRAHGSQTLQTVTVSLFCYEPGPLPTLLRHPQLQQAHWLVAPQRTQAAFEQAMAAGPLEPVPDHHYLPQVAQADFDARLWASDLNLVRGEDSLVRALWAGRALVWQLYPQDDGAHLDKLEAFLDWLDAPASLRTLHRAWNSGHDQPLPPLELALWTECVQSARQRLLAQNDLITQLLGFVIEKR